LFACWLSSLRSILGLGGEVAWLGRQTVLLYEETAVVRHSHQPQADFVGAGVAALNEA
jgi:hypothetical protein